MKRNQFTNVMRQTYVARPTRSLIWQSSNPPGDGSRSYFTRGNEKIYKFAPEFTADGGHRNGVGWPDGSGAIAVSPRTVVSSIPPLRTHSARTIIANHEHQKGLHNMLAANTVAQQVREFIVENFLYGQERTFKDDDSFLGEGIVDSTGVLQLVSHVEETYGITVEDEDLIPENMDSINNVVAYLSRKMNPVTGAGGKA